MNIQHTPHAKSASHGRAVPHTVPRLESLAQGKMAVAVALAQPDGTLKSAGVLPLRN